MCFDLVSFCHYAAMLFICFCTRFRFCSDLNSKSLYSSKSRSCSAASKSASSCKSPSAAPVAQDVLPGLAAAAVSCSSPAVEAAATSCSNPAVPSKSVETLLQGKFCFFHTANFPFQLYLRTIIHLKKTIERLRFLCCNYNKKKNNVHHQNLNSHTQYYKTATYQYLMPQHHRLQIMEICQMMTTKVVVFFWPRKTGGKDFASLIPFRPNS